MEKTAEQAARQMFGELNALARRHENYNLYEACPEMERVIVEWVAFATQNMGISRAEAYRRRKRIAANVFEHRHAKTMWKEFHLHKDGRRKRLLAYTIHGEGQGEERATIEQLAYENGCNPEDIEIEFSFKPFE